MPIALSEAQRFIPINFTFVQTPVMVRFLIALTAIFLINSPTIIKAQSKDEVAFQKVKTHFLNFSTMHNKSVDYNKFNHTLIFNNTSIPILLVDVIYHELNVNGSPECDVLFHCPKGLGCMESDDKSLYGLGIPFKTKNQCYIFINLLADLKAVMASK